MIHTPLLPRPLPDERRQLALLLAVGSALSASDDPAQASGRLAQLMLPDLADLCVIWTSRPEAGAPRVALAHAGLAAPLLGSLAASLPPPPSLRVQPALPPGLGAQLARLCAAHGVAPPDTPASVAIAPLAVAGQTIGGLILARSRPDQAYDAAALPLVGELAGRIALSFDRSTQVAAADQARAALQAAYDRLRVSEERFRRTFDDAAIGMSLVAPDGRWSVVNAALCRMLGYSEAELLTMTYQSITHPDDHVVDQACARRLLSGEVEADMVEKRYIHKDGRVVWVLMSVSLLRDGPGHEPYFLSQKQDITDRKEADLALRAANTRLEQSNRELQDFAMVASHDLQEPLRKIQAFGDRLQSRYAAALGDDGRDYLDRMQQAARRMQSLINDLLTFARISSRAQPFGPVDLATLVSEVLADLEDQIRRTGGRVELGELPTIEADPLQMRQLLQNLISNALKFHRPDTPPLVRIDSMPVAADAAAWPPAPTAYIISVADNGIGFEEKYLDRIFTVFQRLHPRNQFEGTGMGLAICRRIVERHAGQISARSVTGQGSTFFVTLPAHHTPTRLR